MIKYIIRPKSFLSTPRKLKELLNAVALISWPNRQPHRRRSLDFKRDFFLAYPPRSRQLTISNTSQRIYGSLRELYSSSKPSQRRLLLTSFPFPRTYYRGRWFGSNSFPNTRTSFGNERSKYILRPRRHHGGRGYTLLDPSITTEDEAAQLCPGEDYYIQEVFPKKWEYRILICDGTPIVTLLKRNILNLPPEEPWNHTNGSRFITVHQPTNNRLRHTDIYSRIENSLLKHIHLCGIDVMLGDYQYMLSEINFVPSLTLESELEGVKQHVLSRFN